MLSGACAGQYDGSFTLLNQFKIFHPNHHWIEKLWYGSPWKWTFFTLGLVDWLFQQCCFIDEPKKKGLVLKLQVFVKFRILVLLCESWADFDPIWIKVFPILEFWHTLFCGILICWTHNFLTNYDPIWITVFLILEFWETLFYGILPIKKNSLWCLFDLPFPGLLRFIIIIEWDGSSSYWIYIRILKWSNFLNFSLSCWKNQ